MFSSFCKAQQINSKQLLSKSFKYHDPLGKLLQSEIIFDFIETRPNASDRSTTVKCNIKNETFTIIANRDSLLVSSIYNKGQMSFSVNGSDEYSEDVKKKFGLFNERFILMRNYYQFLWLLPIKLEDPGTIVHDEVILKDFFGTEALQLKVTYDPDVGDDIWYFYFDPTSYAMIGYRFYHDEAANDGEYILLEGEQESNGVRIPKTRKWYTHKENKFLGADILDGFWVE